MEGKESVLEPNRLIDAMMSRKSIRKYKEECPSDEMIATIVRAGQQAPATSQSYSVILTRDPKHHPFHAPLMFTICADFHKMERIMARRNWTPITNDLSCLMSGIGDACYMAENMVIAAEALGLGSCYLGDPPYIAKHLKRRMNLPDRVFPVVGLVFGYPDEEVPTRPRYPLDFVLFEERYPELTDEQVERAMKTMDDGFMGQDYYRRNNAIIPLKVDREETYTFDTYGWTEHTARKWGQRWPTSELIQEHLSECGFRIPDGSWEDKFPT